VKGTAVTDRQRARLAWALGLLLIVLAGFGLALDLAAPVNRETAYVVLNTVLNTAFFVVFGLVGVLIISRQPRQTIGWLLTFVGVTNTTGGLLTTIMEQGLPAVPEPTPGVLVLLWLNSWGWWLLMGPLLLILLLFPTGRLLSRRWRWVVGALGASFVIFLGLATFGPTFDLPNGAGTLPNPLGFLPDPGTPAILGPWTALLASVLALCVASVFVRYRRAAGAERAQIRWFLFACGLFLAVFLISAIRGQFEAVDIWTLVFDIAIMGIPLSIGVAILRYRLYDIDVLIRRTLVYLALTGLLALVYFGSVVILQGMLRGITGDDSPLVIVLSTLLIAALFAPVRARVQRVIDRRFYRRKYDAAQTLASFGAQARDETDLERLSARLEKTGEETMQPASVGLWLAARGRGERP